MKPLAVGATIETDFWPECVRVVVLECTQVLKGLSESLWSGICRHLLDGLSQEVKHGKGCDPGWTER